MCSACSFVLCYLNAYLALCLLRPATCLQRSNDYLVLSRSQSQAWQEVVHRERQRRRRLEEAVETIARQHNILESAVNQTASEGHDEDMTDGLQASRSLVATLDDFAASGRSATSLSDDEGEDIFQDCVEEISSSASLNTAQQVESEPRDSDDWPAVTV